MTLDEYNNAITRIHEELERIAQQTAQQAWAGSANTSNPLFNKIMARQAQLIKVTAELNERMLTQMGVQM